MIGLTKNQLRLTRALHNQNAKTIVIGIGDVGVGKTQIACRVGMDLLKHQQKKRFVMIYPEQSAAVGNKILECCTGPEELRSMVDTGSLVFAPFSQIPVDLLSDAFVLINQAQKIAPMDMKSLLTSVGEGCHVVILGSPTRDPSNALTDLRSRIEREFHVSDESCFSMIEFSKDDILLSPNSVISKRIMELYQRTERHPLFHSESDAGSKADS